MRLFSGFVRLWHPFGSVSLMIEISVLLATHNRAAFLKPCLASLCAQSLDPSRYEICVIDNGSTDSTPAVVDEMAARFPKHKVFRVWEPKLGLSRARNCGMENTKGAYLANIDDDGTVNPDWLELFLRNFAEVDPDVALVGGDIEPVWEAPKPEWMTHVMELYLSAATRLGSEPRFLNEDEPASEGNSCYRRTVLEKAGGFPEELGRAGSCLLSGEHIVETRVRQNGGRVFYDPRIILKHFIHADRLNPMWFRHRLFWQGISEYATREYSLRHGLPVSNETHLDIPFRPQDWKFVQGDTPENLEANMNSFRSLGFALAFTGIMPIKR